MKHTTSLFLLLLSMLLPVTAQEYSLIDLKAFIKSESFCFLDSLAAKSYVTKDGYMGQKADPTSYTGLKAFIDRNSTRLNVAVGEVYLDRIYVLTKDEFQAFREQAGTASGFVRYEPDARFENKLSSRGGSYIRRSFTTPLYARGSTDSARFTLSYLYNNDPFVSTSWKYESSTMSILNIESGMPFTAVGVDYIYHGKNDYFYINNGLAVRRNPDGSMELLYPARIFSSGMDQSLYDKLRVSENYGSLDFSFTRLWFWEEGSMIHLKFDRSLLNVPALILLNSGSSELPRYAFAKGADLHWRDTKGRSLVHFATMLARTDLVSMLVGEGLSINDRDEAGNTPLLYSLQNKQDGMAKFLLAIGADYKVKNSAGVSAFKMAYRNPRYMNNLLHMYRPLRPGFWLIDFGFSGDALSASNDGTYSVRLGPVLTQRITTNLNIRHEVQFAWMQTDLRVDGNEIIIALPDGTYATYNSFTTTSLLYAPVIRYNSIPSGGVFMTYVGACPEFMYALSAKEEFRDYINDFRLGLGAVAGIEAYSNKVGFMMELRYTHDLTSEWNLYPLRKGMLHLAMGFMF